MSDLDKVMAEQVTRMSNITDEPKPLPDTELQNLLKAFISLINAYLQRLGGSPPPPKVSDTFGSMG